MKWWTKIIFLVAISALFASAYFSKWIVGIGTLVGGINGSLWSKMPFEFQVIMTGFILVIIIGWLSWIIRD